MTGDVRPGQLWHYASHYDTYVVMTVKRLRLVSNDAPPSYTQRWRTVIVWDRDAPETVGLIRDNYWPSDEWALLQDADDG